MGTLLLHDGTSARMFPLAPSTLVGRAWTCLARVEHPACPLYWVELRWMAGAWAWRALGAQARTRGAGARLREDWRALASAFGRGGRITLDDACSIELVDDSPPVPFAVDALTGVPIDADDLQELAEVRPDGIWPLEGRGSAPEGYGDGQIFVTLGRVLRAHVPGAVAHTAETRVDLARADVRVVIDEGCARATFLQGASSVEVEGACVGVLAVYARARADDLPAGGWLRPDEAWDLWVAGGGNPESPTRRVEWERARLRGRLARAGVASVELLFELRREGDTMRTRLGDVAVELG